MRRGRQAPKRRLRIDWPKAFWREIEPARVRRIGRTNPGYVSIDGASQLQGASAPAVHFNGSPGMLRV